MNSQRVHHTLFSISTLCPLDELSWQLRCLVVGALEMSL